MWEVTLGDQIVGPVDEAHVLRMITEGLPADAKVRPVGDEKWRPLGAHEPFADALAEASTKPAAPPAAPSPVSSVPSPFLPYMQPPPASSAPSPFLPYMQAPMPPPRPARIVRAPAAFIGTEGFILGLGFIVASSGGFLVMGVINASGILIGIVLLLLAFLLFGRSRSWKCGACGNAVENREVRMCPTCRSPLAP